MLPSILRNKHFIGGELIYISISEVEFKKMKVYHWYITTSRPNEIGRKRRDEEKTKRKERKEISRVNTRLGDPYVHERSFIGSFDAVSRIDSGWRASTASSRDRGSQRRANYTMFRVTRCGSRGGCPFRIRWQPEGGGRRKASPNQSSCYPSSPPSLPILPCQK